MLHEASAATVTTMTASVHILQVGTRQVTLSVYRQLDWIDARYVDPMGRVNEDRIDYIQHGGIRTALALAVVGAARADGSLVRSRIAGHTSTHLDLCLRCGTPSAGHDPDLFHAWSSLPLIVLAGLK